MGAPAALIETWTLYTAGSLIILARIASRWRTIGVRGFKPDDYLIFLSWGTYTVMTVAAHIVGGVGDLHALSPDVRKAMTPEEAAPFVHGTQWFCAGVATYILFIWTLKLNMLFLYQRVVKGLWVEKFIKPTMYLVGTTFIAIYLLLFFACRPYNRMWIVWPDQGPICQPQSFLNMVPPLVMNLVTDICILLIPTPVVLPVKTTLMRRVGFMFLFGAGVFIMIAAVLRVTFVLVQKNGATAAIWSCREDFVAILVGQAILILPMFTSSFWTGSHNKTKNSYASGPGPSFEMGGVKKSNKSKNKDPFSITAALATVHDDSDGHDNGSTERIIADTDGRHDTMATIRQHSPSSSADLEKGASLQKGRMVIHVSKQVHVENSETRAAGNRSLSHHGLRATNQANCWNEEEKKYENRNQRNYGEQNQGRYTGRAI